MEEISLTIFDHGAGEITEIVAEFEKRERVKVNLEIMPWDGGWGNMINIALNRVGPDISEVGTTWTGDLVKMNALASLNPGDLRQIGSPADFLPEAWASIIHTAGGIGSPERVWGIPWTADTRLIFYRRDVLERHGIDPATAFTDHAALLATLTALKAGGEPHPLSLMTGRSRITIHNVASYVWGLGGAFTTPGEQRINLDTPAVQEGIRQYLELGQFIAKSDYGLFDWEAGELFTSGQAAVTISGYWILDQAIAGGLEGRIGIAPIPGVPWLGGMNFVVWQHCRNKRLAVRLLKHLSQTETSGHLFPEIGIPVRKDRLEAAPYSTETNYQILRTSLFQARSFTAETLWGLIENRLTDLFPHIWEAYLQDPQQAVEPIIEKFILPLNRRLNLTLKS